MVTMEVLKAVTIIRKHLYSMSQRHCMIMASVYTNQYTTMCVCICWRDDHTSCMTPAET